MASTQALCIKGDAIAGVKMPKRLRYPRSCWLCGDVVGSVARAVARAGRGLVFHGFMFLVELINHSLTYSGQ